MPTLAPSHARHGIPPSDYFQFRDGQLWCEQAGIAEIARTLQTPSYVYSAAAIDDAYHRVVRAMRLATRKDTLVAYAIKANANLAILARLARLGCGADIVSGGELLRALRAGIEPKNIVFSGVGKRRDEIQLALEKGIRALHIESLPELAAVEEEAARRNTPATIALRVNPNVDAKTHPYIATGLHDTKFGLEIDVARTALGKIVASPHLRLEGIACHIGSQLETTAPLQEAVAIMGRFAIECREVGAAITSIDVGGGWPMDYGDETSMYPPFDQFGEAIASGLREAGATDFDLITEPGRVLAGPAGVLLTEVLYIKDQAGKRFVIVDAAMTELIRPALYHAYHAIVAVQPRPGATTRCDVVGPVCESGDFLGLDRELGPLEPGDLLAVYGAGAYGREMASTYNARPLAPEGLVEGNQMRIVRRRPPVDSLWSNEVL